LGAGFDPGVVVVGPGVVVFAPFVDGQAVALEIAEGVEAFVFAILKAAGLAAAAAAVALLGVERPKETFSKIFEKISSALREVLHQHAEFVLSARCSAGFVHPVFFEPSQYLGYSSNPSLLSVD